MRYHYLSHTLAADTPGYGGKKNISIKKDKSQDNGDSANTHMLSMSNHSGTHIDCPAHFFRNGRKISDYPANYWFFKHPCVIKVQLGPSETLRLGEWCNKIKPQNDIVIFVSGWTKFRDKEKYVFRNPGIHPEAGLFLRKKCPKIRAIGIDWISISPYENRVLGRESHMAFLNPNGKREPILIIEDMKLSPKCLSLKELVVLPMIIKDLDGCPCTAIGRLS